MVKVKQGMIILMCTIPAFVLAEALSTLAGVQNKNMSAQSQQVFTGQQRTSQQNAKAFGVTAKEWTRYKSIMDGEGRFHWKDTDPRVVLGIYSKNASQRKRYAEIMARKEYELNKRFIDFNQAYLEAFQQLYGNESIMDLTKVAAYHSQFNFSSISGASKPGGTLNIGDRIVLFVSTDCLSCDDYYRQIRDVQEFSALDIYFINDSNEKITQWAKDMGITPDQVKSGSVTLNGDNGMYAKYGRPGLPASFYFNKRDQSVSAFLPE